jgi:hypothetical protein
VGGCDEKALSLSLCLALAAAGAADAADLRVKAPPAVAVYNWTGFYIGGHGGWAWTDKTWRDLSGAELANYTADGGIYGGQVGFNWQTGSYVFGVEAQASFGKVRKGVLWGSPDGQPWICPDPAPTTGRREVLTKWIGTTVENLGTVALRLGMPGIARWSTSRAAPPGRMTSTARSMPTGPTNG